MHQLLFITLLFIGIASGQINLKNDLKSKFSITPAPSSAITDETCTCGVFMSGQFKKGSSDQPKGVPALIQETEFAFPCTPHGTKLCVNKCLESIVKHLPNSPSIICGTIDRDCHRERKLEWWMVNDGELFMFLFWRCLLVDEELQRQQLGQQQSLRWS